MINTKTWVKGYIILVLTLSSILIMGCEISPNNEQEGGTVYIDEQGGAYTLYVNGEPYYIKGVGADPFGLDYEFEKARSIGANSFRTWGAENAGSILDWAAENNMRVLLGIWLDHDPNAYSDEGYKDLMRGEVQSLLDSYKNHPGLLMWSLGNEINLQGADTAVAWSFVNELALMIQQQDPNHPTATVIAGASITTLNNIAQYAPQVEVVGINNYGGILGTDVNVKASRFNGAYMVTEWGPNGHWEVDSFRWPGGTLDRYIEQSSSSKAQMYLERYEYIASNAQCLGSYVFLWGQKQERTPTWYGTFIENIPSIGLNGEACPTVNAMEKAWSGSWPSNRAPDVTDLQINNQSAGSQVTLSTGETFTATLFATDPDGDTLNYVWELLEEPDPYGAPGGAFEQRPDRVSSHHSNIDTTEIVAPDTPGEYRLFGYAFDGNDYVGTANIPFLVH